MAGPQCCENPPAADRPGLGFGQAETFGELKAYVSGPPDAKTAVIIATDIFGFEAPNFRKLADKIATAGYFVVVPDFFYGEPFNPSAYAGIQDWLKNHQPEKSIGDCLRVTEVLKSRGITTIGAAGFCWGAKLVVELAKGNNIQAGVLLHPSFVTVDDVKDLLVPAVKVPIAILGAEIDSISPPELVEQFGAILSAKSEVDSFVKIYPRVAHGWTVRYDEADEAAVKNAEVAHAQMLEWFGKHLK